MASEWLSETWNCTAYMSRMMYAHGYSRMHNLLQDLDFDRDTVDMLLLGVGDIRQILKTVSCVNTESGRRIDELRIHLNDLDDVVLARDVLLLYLFSTVNPKDSEDVLFIWSIWFNMELRPDHYNRLVKLLKILCERSENKVFEFGDDKTKDKCIEIWTRWAEDNYEKIMTRQERNSVLNWAVERSDLQRHGRAPLPDMSYRAVKARTDKLDETTVSSLSTTIFMSINNAMDSLIMSERLSKGDWTKQISEWIKKGSIIPKAAGSTSQLRPATSVINPTLMRPGRHQWHLHYLSNPFKGFITNAKLLIQHGLTNACYHNMKELLISFQKKLSTVKLMVTAWWGDCIPLCLHDLPADSRFDLIHTTNLADHLGLLNVLIMCEPRLRSSESLLVTGSMRWDRDHASLDAYLDDHLGFPRNYLPTMFGVHLAEDLKLGLTSPPTFSKGEERQLRWTRCHNTYPDPIDISDNSEISQIVIELLRKIFPQDISPVQQRYVTDQTGLQLRTPGLAAAIIHKLKDRIKGGADVLMKLIKKSGIVKRSACNDACWRAVLAAYGLLDSVQSTDELLCIEIMISTEGLPEPNDPDRVGYSPPAQVVYAPVKSDDISDVLRTGMSLGEISSLFPNYKLDLESGFLQVLILRSDWLKLRDEGCLSMVLGNRPRTLPPVQLDSLNVCVLQSWPVPPCYADTAHTTPPTREFIQLEQVEEFESSYKLTWGVKNDGKKVVIDTPADEEKCSTVKLKASCQAWTGKEKMSTRLSCYVDVNTIHIQIASKRGKVFAEVRKSSQWNLGRCLVPSSVLKLKTLHKLTYKQLFKDHKAAWLIKMMFMGPGETDVENEAAKRRLRKIDPFFNLRETLHIIWERMPLTCRIRLKRDDDGSEERDSDVDLVTLSVHVLRGTPILHVAYLQFTKLHQMRKEKKMSDYVYLKIYDKLRSSSQIHDSPEIKSVRKVIMDDQERHLMMKMLHANSLRLEQPYQEEGHPYIRHSFIYLCYPFILEEIGKFGRSQKTINQSIKDFAESAKENLQPCQSCCSLTNKFCGRCKRVFYCSAKCQKSGWKAHKSDCKTYQ